MIIDTHCHFDMIPNPEVYISSKEKAGDIVIGMTNLPSHFQMGRPHLRVYRHIRMSLGFIYPTNFAAHVFFIMVGIAFLTYLRFWNRVE